MEKPGNVESSEHLEALRGQGGLIHGEERCDWDSEEGCMSPICSQSMTSP